MVCTLEALNLIFSTVLCNWAYYPYLTDGETEAENCEGPGPSQGADRGQNPAGLRSVGSVGPALCSQLITPHTAWEGRASLCEKVCKLCDGKLSIFLKVSGWPLTSNTLSTSVSSARKETAIKGKKKKKRERESQWSSTTAHYHKLNIFPQKLSSKKMIAGKCYLSKI